METSPGVSFAVLAGVRKASLKLLEGASLSGRLSKPLRMKYAVYDEVTVTGRSKPSEIEYILGVTRGNRNLSRALSNSVWRMVN